VETTKTGRNRGKKKQIIFDDYVHGDVVDVDSNEEWYAFAFVCELHRLGLIKDFIYQPESFPLTPRMDYTPASLGGKPKKPKFLFRPHVYTADFMFTAYLDGGLLGYFERGFKILADSVRTDPDTGRPVADVWIDVKGTWMHGAESFSINQKMVFDKHGVYINKTVPKEMFAKLGVPKMAVRTPTGKTSKVFGNMKFITTVLKNLGVEFREEVI
jgi:hypothetical protein